MVKILIGNSNSKIVGFLPEKVQEKLDKELSYLSPGAKYSKKYKSGHWDGRIRFYHKNRGQSFLTGLLSIVSDILKINNIAFKKIDRRTVPEQNMPMLSFDGPSGYQERDYQAFTVDNAIKRTRGILKVATGGGKTMISSQIIGEIKTSPFMYYVLTRDLLDQAYDTLSSTLNVPIGRIGAGHFDLKEINVCTVQSVIRSIKGDNSFKISDYMFDNEEVWDEGDILSYEKNEAIKKILGSVKGIYLDEAHHASSKMCVDIMAASPNAYWRFGGTATPYREDNAEIVLQGLFGKKIVDIDASYLINKGYLLKPYILFNKIYHEDVPNTYASVYSQCVTKNQDFHEQVARTANHLISNGLSTLILVQHYSHGEALKKMIPNAPFVTGKMSGKKRRDCIQDLRDKKIMCMIATTLADEGLDIPTLDAALLAGGGASSTRVNQRVGRTLRPDRGSKNPRDRSIVVIYDHQARFLDRQTRKIKKILKLEKEFNIIDSSGGEIILEEIDDIMGFDKKEDFKLIND